MEVNKNIRIKGELSAYEFNTARDMNTGENLILKDDLLREAQQRCTTLKRRGY